MLEQLLKFLGGDNASKKAFKAMIAASFCTIIVRIFGFLKESLIAYHFGISKYVDFYVLALFFATFFVAPIGSSLGVLLTQKYIKIYNKISENAAAIIYFQCQILGVIMIACIVTMQLIFLRISSTQFWFTDLDESYFLALIPISLISMLSTINKSVLIAKEQFKTNNILPIFIPLSILITLSASSQNHIFQALLIGTVIGFFLEFLISSLSLQNIISKMDFSKVKRSSLELNKIFKAMPSMFLSGILMSSCFVVDQIMAIIAGEGSVAIINFGNRVPLGLISIMAIIWTVLYPSFINYAYDKNYVGLQKSLLRFSYLSVLILLPVCGLFSFFSQDIVKILFERGAFDATDTIIVSSVQTVYLTHIPLYVICMICTRILNSLEKTNIILLGNVLLLVLNVILNLYFINIYGVVGIPIATLASYFIVTIFWLFFTNQEIKIQI